MTKKENLPEHLRRLIDNAAEIEQLSLIHKQVAGMSVGRKHGVEVLNKSAIVLLVACWEDFVEELAQNTFNAIFERARKPEVFPNKVLSLAAKTIYKSDNSLDAWQLAGNGWKEVLESHRSEIFKRHTGSFNTPKPEQINYLFENLVGFKGITEYWSWSGMSATKSTKKLTKLIELRGQIAHKVNTDKSVTKAQVVNYTHFIKRIAAICSNQSGLFVARRVRRRPWSVNLVYVGHKS